MSNWRITIADLIFTIALAVLLVGMLWLAYLQYRERRRRLEIIHQERLAAMEKAIPLPEFPALDPIPSPFLITRWAATRGIQSPPPNPQAGLLTGIIFLCLSVGGMIVLFVALPPENHVLWILPLPLALVGIGLLLYYGLSRHSAK